MQGLTGLFFFVFSSLQNNANKWHAIVIPGYCDAPYIEVCCRKYGITVLVRKRALLFKKNFTQGLSLINAYFFPPQKPETGVTNLEQWITIWGIENFNFDYKYKNGFIATLCEDDIHDDE